jgi:hypothetical protein
MRSLLVVAVLLAGCGDAGPTGPSGLNGAPGEQGPAGAMGVMGAPGQPGAPAYTSGSRIRVKTASTGDGAKLFRGLFDGDLGVDCAPGLANDGKLRCLPTTTVPVPRVYYGNNDCTVLLAPAPGDGSCEVPRYAVQFTGACGVASGQTIYAIAGPFSGQVYTVGASNACVPADNVPPQLLVGAAVDPTTFAEVTEQVE